MPPSDPTAQEPSTGLHAEGDGRRLDEMAANATVASVTRVVDGWLCKLAWDLPFRRANAVLPVVGAGEDHRAFSVAMDAIEAWYAGWDRRVLVQVSSADPTAEALDGFLAERGYRVEAPVDLLVADTTEVADVGSPADGLRVAAEEGQTGAGPLETRVAEGVSECWARTVSVLHGDDEVGRERTRAYAQMLGGLGPEVLAANIAVGDQPVGVGFAVLEQGWAGIYGMATAPGWRGMGVGGSLLGALATEARHRHGQLLYLQVQRANAPAQALYRQMGFNEHHRYHYRVSRSA